MEEGLEANWLQAIYDHKPLKALEDFGPRPSPLSFPLRGLPNYLPCPLKRGRGNNSYVTSAGINKREICLPDWTEFEVGVRMVEGETVLGKKNTI